MRKQEAIKTIRAEIDRLNREIDLRIIKGLPYRRESQRHKSLMAQLTVFSHNRTSWLSRSLSFVSVFMF